MEGGDHPPCGAENESYYALMTLADCLGLEHNKDKSSVMGGASTGSEPHERRDPNNLHPKSQTGPGLKGV